MELERFSNKEFDELQVKAMSELDRAKRDAMYERMQDLMEESGSYIFLTHGVNAALNSNASACHHAGWIEARLRQLCFGITRKLFRSGRKIRW